MTALPNSERLAHNGTVSFPRPRVTPAGRLLALAAWWLLWTLLCFAAGVLAGRGLP